MGLGIPADAILPTLVWLAVLAGVIYAAVKITDHRRKK
jgi:hypothetical protein